MTGELRGAELSRRFYVEFWVAAMEGYAAAPYDGVELARLRREGVDDPEDDSTVLVEGPPGAPRLWFQLVPEPKSCQLMCIGSPRRSG